jgi:integrase
MEGNPMASGPYPDPRRGTWSVQWFDGIKWRRHVVVKKRPGWKPGDALPKKPPAEALAALAIYVNKEQAARRRRGVGIDRTVADFLGDYRESYSGRKQGSQLELDKAIKVFLTWCAGKGIHQLEAVTSAVCHQWMNDRARTKSRRTGKPIAHATLKKERALLARAWAEAVRREEMDRNPWISVTVPGKPVSKKRESWTPEELGKLLAASAPWLRDLLLIGCHTGLRIAALMALEWRDIHWAKEKENPLRFGFIEVRPETDKAGKGYSVPIDRVCHDTLARRFLHRDAHITHVLIGKRGKPIRRSSITEKAIRAACKRAGLKNPDSPNHHMRRTFGRQAVFGQLITGRPIPLYVVSKWMGHSSVQMTERYLALSHDDSARWMEEVEAEDHRLGQADGGQEPVST